MNHWAATLDKIKLLASRLFAGGGIVKPRASGFSGLFEQMRQAEAGMREGLGGLESQFLSASSELEVLAGIGANFVAQVEGLVGVATGKQIDRSVFLDVIQLIQQSNGFLVRCLEETTRMREMLRNYNSQIRHLLEAEARLQRTMLPLKFVQTLFKVESAPLGPEIQQMFGSLTEEIESLHTRVREIFGTNFEQLRQTHHIIGQVVSQLDAQAETLHQITTTHKAQIETSLETLKKEMTSNLEREVRLNRVSKEIAREIGQVVIGMQFQDIVSQQLQHVSMALPQIETKFNELGGAGGGEAFQFLRQSCRLEAGQVQAVQTELAKADSAIKGGIQKVLRYLTEMDSECLSLKEFTMLTTSFDGMVQVLIESIHEVRDLVAQTVTSAGAAYEMLRPLGCLTSDLTATVRDISARIHLIGVNAQVQAACSAQDRPGTGLEVLSARTSEISAETNRISEEAATQLDSLAAGLTQSVKILGTLKEDGVSHQQVIDQQGQKNEDELHAFRNKALETLRGIGTSLDKIRAHAGETLTTVDFTQIQKVALPALQAPLVALAEAAESRLSAEGRELASASLIEDFKAKYTMASEREVFAGVAAAGGNGGAKTNAGQDVDFFASESTLAGMDKNKAAPALAGGGGLGDNVELF